jgi:hypothetical protein
MMKRHKLVAHDREEKFNPAFNGRGPHPRYKRKRKTRRPLTILRYQYAGRGRWERVGA